VCRARPIFFPPRNTIVYALARASAAGLRSTGAWLTPCKPAGAGSPASYTRVGKTSTYSARLWVTAPPFNPGAATMNGARALGRTGELGELTAGALADFILIPHSGSPAQAIEAVVNFKGEVSASMINGRWVFGDIPAAR